MAHSQMVLVQLADQLQALAAQIRSIVAPSQNSSTTQSEAHDINKLCAELRDMNARLQVVETRTQGQESSVSSIEELKTRLDYHDFRIHETHTAIERIDDGLTEIRKQLLMVTKDVTAWKAYKHNEDAKAYNRRNPADYHLRPLHHPKTDLPIEGFPVTLEEIKVMKEDDVDRILRILGDRPDRYRPSHEQRSRLAAIVQGLNHYLE